MNRPFHGRTRTAAAVVAALALGVLAGCSSSSSTTSAPPALRAWQLESPEPPSPNTATVLPAKEATGIMMGSSP